MAWDVFYLQDTRKWFPNSAMVSFQVHRGVHVRISASELQRTRICLGPSMQQVSGNTLPVLEPKLMLLFILPITISPCTPSLELRTRVQQVREKCDLDSFDRSAPCVVYTENMWPM